MSAECGERNEYRVILDAAPGISVPAATLNAGSHAADRALSCFDAAWMRRLQPLASMRREDLDGFDYLDSSVLEYALYKALEAAYPQTGGEPPAPLTRNSFVLRIVDQSSLN
jgi:hypothetical protein